MVSKKCFCMFRFFFFFILFLTVLILSSYSKEETEQHQYCLGARASMMFRAHTDPWKAHNVERRLRAFNAVPAVGTEGFASQVTAISVHPITQEQNSHFDF